ncbi:MAG: alpha/beta hydrolase [Planctomycetaceae bacterium]|nr:alpha/beta hydrolase [Planctomycetaceae bacterium]
MPATHQEWKDYLTKADAKAAQTATRVSKMLGTTLEPVNVNGVKCYWVRPKEIAEENIGKLLVHVHGGAYVQNSGLAATTEGSVLAATGKILTLSIDYRMPPDHPYPAAPNDVLAVWKSHLNERKPENIVMGGTSAGGGLIMVTMLQCKQQKLQMPAAIFLGTPGADISEANDSLYTNAEIDHQLGRYAGRMIASIKLYAGDRNLKDPMLSPYYGDLSGFPPAILVTGTRDMLLSATVLTHRKLRRAGVEADLHVFEGMSHADYLVAFPAPEAVEAFQEIAQFFRKHLKK